MHPSYSGSGSHRATFYQVLQDAHSLFFGQDHISEWPCVWLREGLFAGGTAVSLLAISVLPELISWLIAGWAVHFGSSRYQRKSIKLFKHCQEKNK
jgi:hypothetical protein